MITSLYSSMRFIGGTGATGRFTSNEPRTLGLILYYGSRRGSRRTAILIRCYSKQGRDGRREQSEAKHIEA